MYTLKGTRHMYISLMYVYLLSYVSSLPSESFMYMLVTSTCDSTTRKEPSYGSFTSSLLLSARCDDIKNNEDF